MTVCQETEPTFPHFPYLCFVTFISAVEPCEQVRLIREICEPRVKPRRLVVSRTDGRLKSWNKSEQKDDDTQTQCSFRNGQPLTKVRNGSGKTQGGQTRSGS